MLSIIIQRLKTFTPFQIIATGVIISEILTLIIVSIMSLIIHSRIAYNYLLMGTISAFLVSFSVIWIIIEILKLLQKSEIRYRTLFEQSPNAVVILNPKTNMAIETNKKITDLLGYSTEEFLKLKIRDYEAIETPGETKAHIEKILRQGWGIFETKMRTKSGEIKNVIVNTRVIKINSELVFHNIFHDFTENKKMEEKINYLNRLLLTIREIRRISVHEKNQQKMLQSVCETLIKMKTYRFVWIGFITEEHKQVKPMAYAGLKADYLKSITITWDDTPAGQGPTGTSIKTRRPSIARDILNDPNYAPWRETAIKHGYQSSAAFPLIAGEKIYGAINIYSSILNGFNEEETQLLNEFAGDLASALLNIENKEKADELGEIKNKFITIISHQLRTPLSTMRWSMELLLAEKLGKLKKNQEELLRTIHEENILIIQEINNLLALVDIGEKRLYFNKKEVSIESLWNSILSDLKKKCKIKNIQLTYKKPARPLPPIMADADKIRRVFLNLSTNAINYTPDKRKIEIKLEKIGNFIHFKIKDAGIGIPETEQHNIFTQYFRASNASLMKPNGSGAGLYISKYFIESHGGKIGFKSIERKGSTFWFNLPIK